MERFSIKNLGDYPDLHMQSNTLLQADIHENCQNKCIETNELLFTFYQHQDCYGKDAWKRLKYQIEKIELLTDINMLQMVEKDIN